MDESLLEKSLDMPPNERVVFAELILASIDRAFVFRSVTHE